MLYLTSLLSRWYYAIVFCGFMCGTQTKG